MRQEKLSQNDIDLQIIDSKASIISQNRSKIIQGNNNNNQASKHKQHDPFQYLKKNTTNLFNQLIYTDDSFKLQQPKQSVTLANPKKLSIVRLRDIYPINTPLFPQVSNHLNTSNIAHFPYFIPQFYILPISHYQSLIQPKYINQNGFYHVVIYKDGRLIKETIDDMVYYDEIFKQVYDQYQLGKKQYIWVHIIKKVWAKCKSGYNNINKAEPFQFLKTFSYPDWYVINPALEDLEKLIAQINPILKKEVLAIAKTNSDPNVGLYGLVPNSTSYLIVGYEMEYQAIFIKIKSLTGTKWNKRKFIQNGSSDVQENNKLQQNQFIIPIKDFLNLFHLIYITSNKFNSKQDLYYNRYSLNLDARQSKAKLISFEVSVPDNIFKSNIDRQKQKDNEYMTNLTIYFPNVRPYQLTKQRKQSQNNQLLIPYCKLMFGLQSQTSNLQASFVQSMKQKMLQNDQTDFLCIKSNIQYQWIQGTYFKGYDNSCTFLMKLKPGKYLLRFKIQTLRVQYRANINVVSSTPVRISDPKMDKKQHQQFLKQIISSKARLEKRNIGYFNPIKKGSWYICNNDIHSIGYAYLVVQIRKNSDYKIQIKIDPQKLKQQGYRLKNKKEQNKYSIFLEDGQGQTMVLKVQENIAQNKQKIWPPPGIQIIRHWRKISDKQK